jgi:hypothetical protein
MSSVKLMDYFNKAPRLGCLATANAKGDVNAAYFGSPRMIDEKHVVMGLTRNRTFEYLQENPQAVFIIMESGRSISEWKGARLYVKMIACHTSGENLERIKEGIAKEAGATAAGMIHAAVTFKIEEIRPLADFGQGWEKSIG